MSNVVQDLELSHQSLVFTSCSTLWWKKVKKKINGTQFLAYQVDFNFIELHDLVPLSILTATVLQLEVLSIPNAVAWMTLPKAPWPRGFPDGGRHKVGENNEEEREVYFCVQSSHFINDNHHDPSWMWDADKGRLPSEPNPSLVMRAH